jgi:hypothetical protein
MLPPVNPAIGALAAKPAVGSILALSAFLDRAEKITTARSPVISATFTFAGIEYQRRNTGEPISLLDKPSVSVALNGVASWVSTEGAFAEASGSDIGEDFGATLATACSTVFGRDFGAGATLVMGRGSMLLTGGATAVGVFSIGFGGAANVMADRKGNIARVGIWGWSGASDRASKL